VDDGADHRHGSGRQVLRAGDRRHRPARSTAAVLAVMFVLGVSFHAMYDAFGVPLSG